MNQNTQTLETESRGQWKSSFGFIMAAAGSAVGLGNLWKFPYLAGKNGGGAFVAVYLFFIILVGATLILAEMAVGRKGKSDAYNSFKAINKNWGFVGLLGIVTSFLILSFYNVIGGWVLKYIVEMALGGIQGDYAEYFVGFISSPWSPVIYTFIFLGATAFIVVGGVSGGIEKASKFMMPALFVLLIAVGVRSVTLPGAQEGIKFFLTPDFSKLTGGTIVAALGQVFFSLSLGMGIMVTYGSYLPKNDNMIKNAFIVPALDTLVALLAGFAILPAVFALGFEPSAGPGLMFITLPAVFAKMPMGSAFGVLFFVLVLFAALSSSISLLETSTAFAIDHFKLERKKALVYLCIAIAIIGALCSLANGPMGEMKILGRNFFDLLADGTDKILLPAGGLLTLIFVGYIWKDKNAIEEITNGGELSFRAQTLWSALIKFVLPVVLTIILLTSIGIVNI